MATFYKPLGERERDRESREFINLREIDYYNQSIAVYNTPMIQFYDLNGALKGVLNTLHIENFYFWNGRIFAFRHKKSIRYREKEIDLDKYGLIEILDQNGELLDQFGKFLNEEIPTGYLPRMCVLGR